MNAFKAMLKAHLKNTEQSIYLKRSSETNFYSRRLNSIRILMINKHLIQDEADLTSYGSHSRYILKTLILIIDPAFKFKNLRQKREKKN
ncbi:hypothetical protein BpHYR1_034211 [Brachionus plicatilis]|uniref:Uncharacterized protein n=1 Tax=Brachionus plicatilis TaxID=10195 RepID=A0A3M7SLM7_BRAPC|nr:hypothetical protein BpHYR1_034211 [Brachionus plicatilis]